MSTEIEVLENTGKANHKMVVTQFVGSKGKGKMIQLTQGPGGYNIPGYVQLTRDDATKIARILVDWLEDKSD